KVANTERFKYAKMYLLGRGDCMSEIIETYIPIGDRETVYLAQLDDGRCVDRAGNVFQRNQVPRQVDLFTRLFYLRPIPYEGAGLPQGFPYPAALGELSASLHGETPALPPLEETLRDAEGHEYVCTAGAEFKADETASRGLDDAVAKGMAL